ncbi:MAG: metallophosphoesterase family protein [Planctomycetaceae bacterium]|nr:metallophosphoesterase family protein [Planctomycetaceae bacterium]
MSRSLALSAVLLLASSCGPGEAPPQAPVPRKMLPSEEPSKQESFLLKAPAQDGPIRRGPYVQAVGTTTATICFELWQDAEGTVECDGKKRSSVPGTRHEIALTGLRPYTRYDYTVQPGEVKASFRTSPEGGDELSFLAWGDCRTYYERLARMASLAAKDLADFSVHTGDLVDEGTVPEDWDRFFEAAAPLLRTGALWPSMGNHEYDAKLYYELFILPDPERYYTFVAGPAQFYILDADWTGRRDPKQAAWFESELQKSRSRFKFVVLHQPVLSCPCDDYSPATSMYRIFGGLIERYRVTAVFQGHNHNYQRAERNGVLYITTGGAGAPLYSIGDLGKETKFAKVVNHYCRVRLSGRRMTLEAVDLNGAVFDRDERTLPP